MELKTEAIVLTTQKIKDNATLVKLYTKENGFSTFLLYGAQSKKKGKCLSLLHPLSILSIEANIRNTRELNYITELKQEQANLELLFNPVKSSIAFFIAEILLQVLRTNEQDELLFDYIKNAVTYLDRTQKGLGNFHIMFLIRLTRFLGFQPTIDTPYPQAFFDMKQVEYTIKKPEHNYFLQSNETQNMQRLLRMNYRNFHLFKFTRKERSEVIDKILDYYRIHSQGLGEIKSLYVLKEIFDE